ncbi:MAG: DUF559 domain-containing protein [Bacteroidales bacterium]
MICRICQKSVSEKEIEYSVSYKMPLCIGCQKKVKELRLSNTRVTNEQAMLFLALKHRRINAELEYEVFYDVQNPKNKITLDIAIPDAKLYIEVNGMQHAQDYKQQIKDLKRAHYSFLDGFLTLPIYNVATAAGLNDIVNTIRSIADARVEGSRVLE